MMKKLALLLLSMILTMAIFIGCSSENKVKESSDESSQEDNLEKPRVDPELSEIVDAVKNVYGDNYIPNNSITEEVMTSVYEIDMDNVKEFIGEESLISLNVDCFIAIKAKDGKGEEIEENIIVYRDKIVNDTLQYPMNIPKVGASQVIREGDYVFFVMLGGFDQREDSTEEERAEYAVLETQKGIDEIENFFKFSIL